jgi:hypothetical protein
VETGEGPTAAAGGTDHLASTERLPGEFIFLKWEEGGEEGGKGGRGKEEEREAVWVVADVVVSWCPGCG